MATGRNRLTWKVGDILNASEDIIVQQVNCRGVMGAGLGLQLRNKYPEMYEKYERDTLTYKSNPEQLLGRVNWYEHDPHETGKPLVRIASIYGQLDYGREKGKVYTNEDKLLEGLLQVDNLMRRMKLTVAVPYRIGCGLAKGDWKNVRTYLESFRVLHNQFTTIYALHESDIDDEDRHRFGLKDL